MYALHYEYSIQMYCMYTLILVYYKTKQNVVWNAIMCLKDFMVNATNQLDVAKQSVQIFRANMKLEG